MFTWSCVLTLVTYFSLVTCDFPIVKTNYGYIKGKYNTSRSGREFSSFLGIPYAAPPIGNLRFKPPEPPTRWEGVKDAIEEEKICSQGKYGGKEDCLFVNVFSHLMTNGTLMPVMFFIHGGAFYMGSSTLGLTGPEYFMDKDIVLVTVQYRLGPFGFLSSGDSVIPGNMGLKDQVMALTWVRDNIRFFGGDPERVTLFGSSVGASSVHLHMQSPMSQHLFAKGISQSGTALTAFALTGKGTAKRSMLQFAEQLNCTDLRELIICLQLKNTQEIEDAHRVLQNSRYAMMKSIFRPVVEIDHDNAFITQNPFLATTHKSWLLGVTANEGILDIPIKYLNYTIEKIQSDPTNYFSKALLLEDLFLNASDIEKEIHKFFFKNSTTRHETVASMEKLYTDWWYLWPLEESARRHNGTLYCYIYDHLGEFSYVDIYNSPRGFGVSHLDDLISLFKHSKYFGDLNTVDKTISELMVDLWVNFATYGDPTPFSISRNPQAPGSKDFKWEKSDKNRSSCIHIRTEFLSNNDIFTSRLQFWRNLVMVYNI